MSWTWSQISQHCFHSDGIVVFALFPSVPVDLAYQSGYAPTGENGIAIRVEGRQLFEIDGRLATKLLNARTSGAVSVAEGEPRSILAEVTLWLIGPVLRKIADLPFHVLSHSVVANPNVSIDLFAQVTEGDQLWQIDALRGR